MPEGADPGGRVTVEVGAPRAGRTEPSPGFVAPDRRAHEVEVDVEIPWARALEGPVVALCGAADDNLGSRPPSSGRSAWRGRSEASSSPVLPFTGCAFHAFTSSPNWRSQPGNASRQAGREAQSFASWSRARWVLAA